MGTDPPVAAPKQIIFCVPSGTEKLIKSPWDTKSSDNSNMLYIFNNNM